MNVLFFSVRHRVKELLEFIQDDDRLREERKKAKKTKEKYIGVSNEDMGMGGGGGGSYSKLLNFRTCSAFTCVNMQK